MRVLSNSIHTTGQKRMRNGGSQGQMTFLKMGGPMIALHRGEKLSFSPLKFPPEISTDFIHVGVVGSGAANITADSCVANACLID